MSTTGFSAPACEGGVLAVSGLSPAVQPDFIQMRQIRNSGAGEEAPTETVKSSQGVLCESASDQKTCEAVLNGITLDHGFTQFCSLQVCFSFYLTTTRGDAVAAFTTPETLREFLGPIDTAQEAVLMAFAAGYDVGCDSLSLGAVRANAGGQGGFQVIATQGLACNKTPVRQFLLNVSAAGEVSEVSSSVLEKGGPNCPPF